MNSGKIFLALKNRNQGKIHFFFWTLSCLELINGATANILGFQEKQLEDKNVEDKKMKRLKETRS